MQTNDVLRRVRYALDIKDADMITCFSEGGVAVTRDELLSYMRKEDAADYKELSPKQLEGFLDGLIVMKRGRKNG